MHRQEGKMTSYFFIFFAPLNSFLLTDLTQNQCLSLKVQWLITDGAYTKLRTKNELRTTPTALQKQPEQLSEQ